MRYGIGYLGSKSQIADEIIATLPFATKLYDLFGGGGAISHCAVLSGKFDKVIYNDVGDIATLFKWAVNGIENYVDISEFITREKFFKKKDTNPYVKYAYSFGNSGQEYLYGRDVEEWKEALHNAIVFDDVSGFEKYGYIFPVLSGENIHEKRMAYRRYMKSINGTKKHYYLQHLQHLEYLERLQHLERLERLQNLEHLQRLEILNKSYDSIEITDGIIYCDIPYRNTNCKSYGGFDWDKFYNWAENQVVPVYISEYSMPEERFVEVKRWEKIQLMSSINRGRAIEKLFIPKQQEKILTQVSLW